MPDEDRTSLLAFPCEFPIKVMGPADPDFVLHVVALAQRHVPDLDDTRIETRASSKGRYVSVTLNVTARSRTQLDALYTTLSQDERVSVVL